MPACALGVRRMPNAVGTMNATWIDPDGTEWPLTDIAESRGYFTGREIAGWGAAPYELVTDPQPRGGETLRFIRQQPARITWPLHVWGETHLEFVTRYRALRRAFMMTVHKGLPGILRVARPDGSSREIQAYYEDGWGGETRENWVSANPVLTLWCPEGSWYDTQATTITRSASDTVPFNNPFLRLSPATVLGSTTVNNPGDLTAWPEWTINGPATSITATNHTLGQQFVLTYTLTVGQAITVTTAGPHPNVRGPSGENLSGQLNWPTAYLWGLDPGDNSVEFVVGGSSVDTSIVLSFNARYEGA